MSICAILWYFCKIGAETNSVFDLLKFIYFRSSRCETKFKWQLINLGFDFPDVEVKDRSDSTSKTIFLAWLYFIINLGLVISAFVAICGYFQFPKTFLTKYNLCRRVKTKKRNDNFQLLRVLHTLDCL